MSAARDGEQIGCAVYAHESASLRREPVQMRRAMILPSVTAQIIHAEVIGENHNDVGARLRRALRRERSQQQNGGSEALKDRLFHEVIK